MAALLDFSAGFYTSLYGGEGKRERGHVGNLRAAAAARPANAASTYRREPIRDKEQRLRYYCVCVCVCVCVCAG